MMVSLVSGPPRFDPIRPVPAAYQRITPTPATSLASAAQYLFPYYLMTENRLSHSLEIGIIDNPLMNTKSPERY